MIKSDPEDCALRGSFCWLHGYKLWLFLYRHARAIADRPVVITILQKMCCETVAKCHSGTLGPDPDYLATPFL
jgi:hypothetical protein